MISLALYLLSAYLSAGKHGEVLTKTSTRVCNAINKEHYAATQMALRKWRRSKCE